MSQTPTRIDAARAGYAALALLVILLGLHCRRVMVTVIRSGRDAGPALAVTGNSGTMPELILARRDSVVSAAESGRRDPFRPPPVVAVAREVPAVVARPAPPPPPPDPTLGVLLYDKVSPQVQLRIGGRTSGWLRAGESFDTWTIVQIGPTSVRITNGSRVLDLSSS